ncbi:MAG: SufE family protein [Candidatus Omnitrophica bacterium]|nr:SufE family protein [Candidatus Omnitrophota bacterium]
MECALTIDDVQKRIVEEITRFDEEGIELYEYLVGLGRDMTASGRGLRTDENKISGCQASVWISARAADGKMRYRADSDALITKGLLSLLLRVFDGRSPEEILEAELFFIERTGLKAQLSPVRRTGLITMINRMKELAEERPPDKTL